MVWRPTLSRGLPPPHGAEVCRLSWTCTVQAGDHRCPISERIPKHLLCSCSYSPLGADAQRAAGGEDAGNTRALKTIPQVSHVLEVGRKQTQGIFQGDLCWESAHCRANAAVPLRDQHACPGFLYVSCILLCPLHPCCQPAPAHITPSGSPWFLAWKTGKRKRMSL